MDYLLPIAVKSFFVAGAVLLLLKFAARRSASERSWIAHLGLISLLLLPVVAIALPTIEVETPAFLSQPATQQAPAVPVKTIDSEPLASATAVEAASSAAGFPEAAAAVDPAVSVDWAFWAYAAPAALLVLLTLIALIRLFTLRARANVLVEANWLTALARAQQRMGFKHGTALLTSDELPSPISWGLMRPVIVLNTEAAQSHAQAEAIIAHELAHVASLDWAKLLLSRVTVAMFWFNPFVWLLAREAHQLREEAADDAVLGANIEDTDYANLLVGVARHECRGLLLGAHGVAPAKNSLSRRVRRVLDASSARGPVGGAFALGMFVGATILAAPLAAVTLTPKGSKSAPESGDPVRAYYKGSSDSPVVTDMVSNSVFAAVSGAVAGVAHPHLTAEEQIELEKDIEKELEKEFGKDWKAKGPRLGTVGPKGPVGPQNAIDTAIAFKALGVTQEYIRAIKSAAPQLRDLDTDDITSLKAVGVTPEYIRELNASGYRNFDEDELVEARAIGVRGDYIRGLASVGYPNLSLDQLAELRAVGVTPTDIRRFQQASRRRLTVDQLVELKALGVKPPEIEVHLDRDDADDGS